MKSFQEERETRKGKAMKKIFVPFVCCIICFLASTSMAEWRPIRFEYDNDNDGSIDKVNFYTYDSNGNEIKMENDSDNDGFIDSVWFYTYNSDGNKIKGENDNDNDGFIDSVWFYTYDSDGNLIEEEYNGSSGLSWIYFNNYDSDGNMIKREFDGNNDGFIDYVEFYIYDSNGNLIKQETGVPGSIDEVYFYTYDSNGNLTKEEWDYNNDGLIDSVRFSTYDSDGNLIREEHDNDNDGSIDRAVYITFWDYILQPWPQIGGEVTYEGAPLCAMVLGNGQHMFTCDENFGVYSLEVPLDENSEITLYGFVSGFSPFKIILSPGRALDFDINMTRAASDSREVDITVQTEPGTTNPNWIRISGTVTYDEEDLCAMILANGQSMFSCGGDFGTFDLEVPLDENGEITLYVFCSGFAPYKEVFVP
jgi:hypothetical protein